MKAILRFLSKNSRKIYLSIGLFITGLFALFLISPLLIFTSGKNQIYTDDQSIPNYQVAIVFGASIHNNEYPSDMLKDRLITAAELYHQGVVDKILVSGDNRFETYNEPDVMAEYLINNLDIPAEDIVRDYAGRRTYDTCARAIEIWGLQEALLITQGYHLPRAIFTCNQLGLESEGFSATRQEYLMDDGFKLREILAIYKAVIDLFIKTPDYVGGDHESDFDDN